MATQVPIVTVDDLRGFHAKHFPAAPLPDQFLATTDVQYEDDIEHQDDSLGYYEDGVARTLTDEQIALFRHSEIQTILRERRLRKEAAYDSQSRPTTSPSNMDEVSVPTNSTSTTTPTAAVSAPSAKKSVADKVTSGRVEKQSQWRSGAASERQKRKNAKSRKNNRKLKSGRGKYSREGSYESGQKSDSEDATAMSDEWDPWHQANGPDAIQDTAIDLNY